MKYVLIMTETADEFAKRKNGQAGDYWAAWSAYVKAINEAGIVVSGAGLQEPQLATTVRMKNGKVHVQDGPFADTKEQLGGFFVIDVPTLDVALEWASRSPSATVGAVEVRPLLPPM